MPSRLLMRIQPKRPILARLTAGKHIMTISFVAPCITGRDGALIIATGPHLTAIEAKLRERCPNIDRKLQRGQLVLFDAELVLEQLQGEDGTIVPAKFHELIGTPVRRLVRRYGGQNCAFGEIVNLLCQRGEIAAALQLERMWNDLVYRHRFTLLCAYAMSNFSGPNLNQAFQSVCLLHAHVTPSEDYIELKEKPDDQNAMVASLQQNAKALQSEIERRKAAESALHNTLKVLSDRAQEALTREQHLYSNLLSILPVGVYGSYSDHDECFVNDRFCQIMGLTKVEIRIGGWMGAIHSRDRHQLSSSWPFSQADQDTHSPHHVGSPPMTSSAPAAVAPVHSEYRVVHPDGTIRCVAAQTVANIGPDGSNRGFIHTVMDVTEFKKAELDRLEARQAAAEHQKLRAEEAEAYRRQQDHWIDALCHELRNPLHGIHGNVELLELGLKTREAVLGKPIIAEDDMGTLRSQLKHDAESIDAIAKCVEHQKVLTDDVLNLSKLELGKVTLKQIEFVPTETLTSCAKMFENPAARKSVSLRLDLPLSCPTVIGDPFRLSQVVINLMANAIKFTKKGTVTVGLEVVEGGDAETVFRVSVADTGIGLTRSERAGLFQRFVQPGEGAAGGSGGSGLGLFISKGLVELMGGSIGVRSKKGAGSTFSFTFKARNVNLLKSLSEMGADVAAEKNGTRSASAVVIEKVLVVEDNVINQEILRRFLELKGYVVTVVSNGAEALSFLETNGIDLIFMDVQMPVMDGITATIEIRKRETLADNGSGTSSSSSRPRVPIIGLSGNAREAQAAHALQSGMDEYITKPVRRDSIYAAIDRFKTYEKTSLSSSATFEAAGCANRNNVC
ncbi:hypothetical protein HK104_006766 [Borealophlyctis nickersoniae]|nr:hypothetical protein HK104_006766 [Borealophlyctis nickersoniae]